MKTYDYLTVVLNNKFEIQKAINAAGERGYAYKSLNELYDKTFIVILEKVIDNEELAKDCSCADHY